VGVLQVSVPTFYHRPPSSRGHTHGHTSWSREPFRLHARRCAGDVLGLSVTHIHLVWGYVALNGIAAAVLVREWVSTRIGGHRLLYPNVASADIPPPRGRGPHCSRTAMRPRKDIHTLARASLRLLLKPRPSICGSVGRGFEPRRSPS